MHRRQFLGTVLSAPMIAANWKHGPPPAVEAEILQMMGVAPVPGAVIGVVRSGSTGWIRPLGLRNAETKDTVAQDTVFQAASL